jgi:para-nitrobenzyl esterase
MSEPNHIEVEVSSGRLRGQGGPVRCWLGVPYAQPPVGDLRWRPPQPVRPWTGVVDATRFGADPPQAPLALSRASRCEEDCLNLNVWAPADARGLPVLVWIFGGGFVGGSAADARTDGAQLAAEGAVVVAVNYRVGLAGFMAHPELTAESDHRSSGNYGLMDQILALQWVRGNIAAFGGDPTRITAFGTSAGSASLSLLMTSPHARGLFERAILHSPGVFRRLAELPDAETAASRVAPHVADLRRLGWQELLARTTEIAGVGRSLTGPRVLRPIRDGWLLPHDEIGAARLNLFEDMPLLLGSVAAEGDAFIDKMPRQDQAGFNATLARDFAGAVDEALQWYGAKSDDDVPQRLAEVFGDTQFTWGTNALARLWATRRGAPSWRHLFRRRASGTGRVPTHGDDTVYAFGNLAQPGVALGGAYDEEDEALSAVMRRMWLAFAATGTPQGDGLPAWPALAQAPSQYLALDAKPALDGAWRAPQMAFLDRFFGTPF